jgi:hypothetical protein
MVGGGFSSGIGSVSIGPLPQGVVDREWFRRACTGWLETSGAMSALGQKQKFKYAPSVSAFCRTWTFVETVCLRTKACSWSFLSRWNCIS